MNQIIPNIILNTRECFNFRFLEIIKIRADVIDGIKK
jgi:hypothetical protein